MSEFAIFQKQFDNANILRVDVGANGPRGGHSGHCGPTVFRLLGDEASTDISVRLDGDPPDSLDSLEVVLGGATECGISIPISSWFSFYLQRGKSWFALSFKRNSLEEKKRIESVNPSKWFLVPCALICLACYPVASQATAHCFCKLGPSGSPFYDFGQIKTYKTQVGHDSNCQITCNDAVSNYLSNAANMSNACAAANGGNMVSYSAVGTRPYIAGNTTICPSSPGGLPGSISFGVMPTMTRSITINNVAVNPYAPASPTNVPSNTPFTTFIFTDTLSLHLQQWTYEATLYRDGVKIEQFSRKSPVSYQGGVNVQFTGQPNSFVHGHNWKIEWHYGGPNFQNGSATFFIP